MWQGIGGLPVALLVLGTPCLAHDPATTKLTWTREISRIFQKRCIGCHRQGGVAPMPLETYEQARPWAVAIKEEVLKRSMPPWPAAKGYGEFVNDISLPQEEIHRIAEWSAGGAPEGEKQYLGKPGPVPLWKPPVPPAGDWRRLQGRLTAPVTITAITGWGSGRMRAETPDGRTIPLVWWVGDKPPVIRQPLILREPITLPAGSRIRDGAVGVLARQARNFRARP